MADLFKLPKLEPQPSGVLKQTLVGAVNVSGGAADAGKVVLLNSAGQIDPTMGGGGSGSVSVNGVPVASPNLKDSTSVTWAVVGSDIKATVVGSGTAFQVNGTPVLLSTTINFEDGTGIHISNPSAGNIQFTLSPPTGTFPQTIGAVASKWLNSYDAATGLFAATQPTFTDLAAHPTTLAGYGITDALPSSTVLPITNTGATHKFLTSYSSVTGVFGLGQPAFTDLSDYSAGTASPTLASVIFKGASVGSVTVQAPASLSPPTWTLTLPGNAGSAGWVLQTDGSGVTSWVAATGGAPGLPFNSIQFNNAGTFGGSSNFTYDGSTIVTLAGTMNANVFAVGTLGFVDTHILESLQTNTNSYVQAIIQNTNAGAAASADLIVANNNTTASTFYGDFGINSSGWTGVGGSYNLPNAVYLSATSGDLVIGTTTANAIHFFVNGGATDAMLIDGTTGGVTALVSLTTPQVNVKGATSGVVTIQSLTGTWSLTLPANAGGAGNLLTTDGAGVTSWVSPGATAFNFAKSQVKQIFAGAANPLQWTGGDVFSSNALYALAAPTSSYGEMSQFSPQSAGAIGGAFSLPILWTGRHIQISGGMALFRTTDIRFWFGCFNTTSGTGITNSDTTPTSIYAAFRFSSIAGDTHWQAVTRDGTTQNVVSTGISPDTAQHRFGIFFDDANSQIIFYIDGVSVATLTTNLPPANTALAVSIDGRWASAKLNPLFGVAFVAEQVDF